MYDKICAAAFDLDGTLLDSLPDLALAINEMLVQLEAPTVEQELVRNWVGNGMPKLVERAFDHAQQQGWQGEVELDEALALFEEAYARCASKVSALYPKVKETLAILHQRQIPLAVITNKKERFIPELLRFFEIDTVFDAVIGGDTLPKAKPDPMPLLEVASRFDIQPRQLLMVGDSKNDILAAKAAGSPCVGLTYGYNYGEDIALSQPDWVLTDFDGILPLILE